jgi:hypothetical protein
MATIGSATQTVTLSPSKPDVTLTGTIDAYGPAGAYISSPAAAAVFGAEPGKFTFTNAGTIISAGTGGGALAEGILFGGPGTVFNAGLIEAAGGIGMFSLGKGGLVDNASRGRIHGYQCRRDHRGCARRRHRLRRRGRRVRRRRRGRQ